MTLIERLRLIDPNALKIAGEAAYVIERLQAERDLWYARATAMSPTLVDRVRVRIGKIPATNPGIISMQAQTLLTVLDRHLLQRIAEAAVEAMREDEQTTSLRGEK